MGKRTRKQIKHIKSKLRKLQNELLDISASPSSSYDADSGPAREFKLSEKDLEKFNDKDVSALLRADPPVMLLQEVVAKWTTYLANGLDKDLREDLTNWSIPKNCPTLGGPNLNPEIDAWLPSAEKKKDAILKGLQEKLGRGLAALGSGMNILLEEKPRDEVAQVILFCLVDGAKLFCEVHHLLSKHRKHQIYPLLDNTIQKLAEKSKPDLLLFGKDFTESCKAAQNMKKATNELRFTSPGPSSSSLNSKRWQPKTRMKEPIRATYWKKKTNQRRKEDHKKIQDSGFRYRIQNKH